MGGCCCSSRKPQLHGTPVYYYCPPDTEEHSPLTSYDSVATALTSGLLVDLNLDMSTPDTYRPPPAPIPYDVVLGHPDTNCTDLKEVNCQIQPGFFPPSPRKAGNELKSRLVTFTVVDEEDSCPTCLEEYDAENPKIMTKCNHHFHLSCILEWMERSDNCPICDQLGMASALETLCGQAFGAGEIEMLGVYMQRSWLILIATCICLLPLYIFSVPVLKLLGQRHDIAENAGEFSLQIIPQMFSLAINFPTQKFLQAQSKVAILAWVGILALIVHIGLLFLFIGVFKWGVAGAAVAYDVSAWGISLAQVVYIMGWCQDSWKGFSWLAFKDIWGFVRLSIASAVMLCLEIWYFMSIIVLTGHLEDPVLAVGSLSICMNLNGWEGMLFIGINAAVSVRVSNELGSGHPRAAKYSVFVTVVESLFIGIISMLIIIATRDKFAILFTSSEQMQKAVSNLAYLLAVTMVLNSIQPVISGVAVGGGWQGLVAYINLTCYYLIGLPIGFFLGYHTNLGVKGIWMGMIIGTFLQTVILLIIVWKTNWNDEVAQTSERMRKWGGLNEELDVK